MSEVDRVRGHTSGTRHEEEAAGWRRGVWAVAMLAVAFGGTTVESAASWLGIRRRVWNDLGALALLFVLAGIATARRARRTPLGDLPSSGDLA